MLNTEILKLFAVQACAFLAAAFSEYVSGYISGDREKSHYIVKSHIKFSMINCAVALICVTIWLLNHA